LVADGTTSVIILMSGLFYSLVTLNVMYTHWTSVVAHITVVCVFIRANSLCVSWMLVCCMRNNALYRDVFVTYTVF
jgi:hypothetical protein